MARFVFVHGVGNHKNPFAGWAKTLGLSDGDFSEVFWGELFADAHLAQELAASSVLSLAARVTEAGPGLSGANALPLDVQDEKAIADLLDAARVDKLLTIETETSTATGLQHVHAFPPTSWFVQKIVEFALREVIYYLRNREHRGVAVRDKIREMFEEAIQPGDVVVAHSMGSIIAYDCLSRDLHDAPNAASLVTIGSPLGLNLLRDWLPRDAERRLVMPRRVTGRWSNGFDRKDVFVRLERVEWGAELGLSEDVASPKDQFYEDGLLENTGLGHHEALEYLDKFRDQILSAG
ncbi:MAG: hypothetical protein H6721_27875 [Sandaracinus sp.]|nr:hypothetical protein [Sandaracinus sp.]MCB9615970.1 hypothetical protein [Sandaracinus sp.]MCB9621868.1 hypothetical protein [Sandaracinus sp.]MCB9635946.1 hypothetical protein [Sandaracinus sp.]